jgi:hypothetical protein
LRYLTDRVSLTTVELAAHERADYKPPEAPTFAANVSQTFFDSLAGLRQFGETIVLIVVALVPWLVAFVFFALPLVWLVWRVTRRRRGQVVTATAV